jgi:hypothetical protein
MWQLCWPNGCIGRVGSTIEGPSKGHLAVVSGATPCGNGEMSSKAGPRRPWRDPASHHRAVLTGAESALISLATIASTELAKRPTTVVQAPRRTCR